MGLVSEFTRIVLPHKKPIPTESPSPNPLTKEEKNNLEHLKQLVGGPLDRYEDHQTRLQHMDDYGLLPDMKSPIELTPLDDVLTGIKPLLDRLPHAPVPEKGLSNPRSLQREAQRIKFRMRDKLAHPPATTTTSNIGETFYTLSSDSLFMRYSTWSEKLDARYIEKHGNDELIETRFTIDKNGAYTLLKIEKTQEGKKILAFDRIPPINVPVIYPTHIDEGSEGRLQDAKNLFSSFLSAA